MFRKSFIKSLIKQCENEIVFVNGIKTELNVERYVVNIENEKAESEFEPATDEENKQIKNLFIHEINLLETLANTIVTGLIGGMIDYSFKTEIKLNEIVEDLDSCKEFLMKEYTDHYGEFPEFKR